MGQAAVVRPGRQEKSEETRVALLEATVRCLAEAGYAATTTGRVATMSGVTRGAILHHFSTKTDLMLETARHIIRDQNAFRRGIMQPLSDPYERLVAITDAVWASWKRPHALALLELDLASRGDPELAPLYRPIRLELEKAQRDRYVEICRAAGIDDLAFSEALMTLSVGAMRGMTIQARVTGEERLAEAGMDLLRQMRRDLFDRMRQSGNSNRQS
jgi:AcrR family transcriptional regulator